MKRPFFVHTPRNIDGESLVSESIHNPPYSIRNVLDRGRMKPEYGTGKDLAAIQAECKAKNDAFEVEAIAWEI